MATQGESLAETAPTPLDLAAKTWGIEQQFWDIFGKLHTASPEAERAILRTKGVDAATDDAAAKALEERLWREWSQLLPATTVAGQSPETRVLKVSLPQKVASAALAVRYHWEHGALQEESVDVSALPAIEETKLRGQTFVRKAIPLPDNAPLGYHDAEVTFNGQTQRARLIVCPDRCYLPDFLTEGKAAGLGLNLYAVRSARNWGCGDFTDLKALIDWSVDKLGVSFIALNPLHALTNRVPYNTSPYLPNSVFYKNILYLDPAQVAEYPSCQEIGQARGEIERLRETEFVEYEAVATLKARMMKFLFRRFLEDHLGRHTQRAKAFEQYIAKEGKPLERYAIYVALDEEQHKLNPDAWNWAAWPKELQDSNSKEVDQFSRQHWRGVLFQKYVQWELEKQLASAQDYARQRGMRIGLYHDLALAIDKFGADAWAQREFLHTGARVGSPPDDFSPTGQDWGFPPPNSEHHFADGYRVFAQSIRSNAEHGGALRIDHVMRFFHLYWIPEGLDASHGTYVAERAEDLLHVLALESVRGQFLVVGEDLGTVSDEIRESLDKYGVLSYRLLYFEKDKSGRFKWPGEYPRQALVSATTHDLPTLAGFWSAADIKGRREAGVLPDAEAEQKALAERQLEKQKLLDQWIEAQLLPETHERDASKLPELTGALHSAAIGFLAATPSQLFLLMLEDLLKVEHQQNLPGTTAEYPNWRRKTNYTVEDLRRAEAPNEYAAMVRGWLEKTGRLNPSSAPA